MGRFVLWCEEKDPEQEKTQKQLVELRKKEQVKELGELIYNEIEDSVLLMDSPTIDIQNRIINIGNIIIEIKNVTENK